MLLKKLKMKGLPFWEVGGGGLNIKARGRGRGTFMLKKSFAFKS